MGRFYVLQDRRGRSAVMSALVRNSMLGAAADICFIPESVIRDDVNEKERPPCGGLSKAIRDIRYAALDF
jgi:hypothetical protein